MSAVWLRVKPRERRGSLARPVAAKTDLACAQEKGNGVISISQRVFGCDAYVTLSHRHVIAP